MSLKIGGKPSEEVSQVLEEIVDKVAA